LPNFSGDASSREDFAGAINLVEGPQHFLARYFWKYRYGRQANEIAFLPEQELGEARVGPRKNVPWALEQADPNGQVRKDVGDFL
jgi:hypothetical protein